MKLKIPEEEMVHVVFYHLRMGKDFISVTTLADKSR